MKNVDVSISSHKDKLSAEQVEELLKEIEINEEEKEKDQKSNSGKTSDT